MSNRDDLIARLEAILVPPLHPVGDAYGAAWAKPGEGL